MEQESKPGISKWLLVVLIIVILTAIGFFSWNYMQNKKTDTNIASVNSAIAIPTPDTAIVVPTTTPAVSTSPVSTVDLKTYTNEKYNYSVKYPVDWTIGLDGIDKSLTISSPAYAKVLSDYKVANPNGGSNPPVEDFVLNYYNGINALQCGNMGECTSSTIKDAKLSEYIGSNPAIKTIGNSTFYEVKKNLLGQAAVTYYTEVGAHIYSLTYNNLANSGLSSAQNSILESFKSPL